MFQKDDVLKFKKPRSQHEAHELWLVLEDRGDRVFCGYIGARGPLGHTCVFSSDEMEKV